MEVESAESTDFALRAGAVYATLTAGFVVAVLAPALVSVPYVQIVKTLVLLLVFTQIGRMLLSAALTFSDPEDPPDPPADADLPVVSIVVPAYDEAGVLAETLDACLALDYPANRLAVVVPYEADCTDRTPDIAESYAARHHRIRAVRREDADGGKAHAVNDAIPETTGDVVAVVDADHRLEPDAVRRAAKWFLAEPGTYCVKGRCYGRNPADSVLSLHATVERHVIERGDIFAREKLGGFTLFGGSGGFFRRETFEEVGRFDPDVLLEDIDMTTRLQAAGKNLRVDPEIITTEEHPPSLKGWWEQRKRWARGWLQVSARYLPQVGGASKMSLRQRADAVYTFAYAILLPFLVVGVPLPVLDLVYFPQAFASVPTAFIPHSRVLWTILGVFPVIAAATVFYNDHAQGRSHHPREYLAMFTLGAYLFVQTAAYVVAFFEEFVFEVPATWVTTTRAEDE